ncbi:MAG: carboxymuconolactone decarboxylase family protein [Hyphomicrobiales bacterium]
MTDTPHDQSHDQSNERRERGTKILDELHPDAYGAVKDAMADIAPDFADFISDFAFGDIYGRQDLALRDRQITTIAALAAIGHASPQLKVHIQAGARVGLSRREIVEILMQIALYAGFPATLNALAVAKEAFAELDEKTPGA